MQMMKVRKIEALSIAAPTSFMDNPLIERFVYYVGKIVVLMAMLVLFICVIEVLAIVIGILFLK